MSNRTLSTIAVNLIKARELIINPDHWCIESQGKDKDGFFVLPHNARCTQRCIYGAVGAVQNKSGFPNMPEMKLIESGMPPPFKNAAEFNNTMGHSATIDLLDKAIAKAIQP